MDSGFMCVSFRRSAVVVLTLISACMAAGCKETAVKPAEGVQTAGVAAPEQAPVAAGAALAPVAAEAAEAKPLFRPEGSMLKAGTRLSYRHIQIFETNEEHQSGISYITCDLLPVEGKPTADSFTVHCSKYEGIGFIELDVWQDSGVYEWKADGLWLVAVEKEPTDGKATPPYEPVLVYAKQPKPENYAISNLVSYEGGKKAFCTVPPKEDEEYGDITEIINCYDLRNGYIVSEHSFSGGAWCDNIWNLIDVSTTPGSGGVDKTDPAVETAAKDLLARWLRDQNLADFEDYKTLYAPSFTGVRRTDRAIKEMSLSAWLTDRGKMFAKPMTVAASDVQVLKTNTGSRILFTQYWQSGKYADEGRKEIVINNGYPPGIVREEMIDSKRVPVRQ